MIQVWCGLPNIASWDPECLALALVVAANNLDIPVIATNSTLDGNLPAMDDFHGLVEIADSLRARGLIEYSDSDVCAQFYAKNMSVLSLYLLFESQRNYEELTRPTISAAVPFPMQYNLTVGLQRDVKARTAALLGEMPQQEPTDKALSKTHGKMLQQSQNRREAIKSTKRTAHVLSIVDTTYTELEKVLDHLNASDPPCSAKDTKCDPASSRGSSAEEKTSFGVHASPAYCLIAANLLIHSAALPDAAFLPVLKKHPKLEKIAAWATETQPKIPQQNKYTLQNYIRHRINSTLNSFSA